jgi:hypothetical protein
MTIWMKRTVFALAASYIALSPALPQIFGWGAPFVRQWTMYSEVGEGLPKGVFTAHYEDGRTQALTPLQVRELERYPDVVHYAFEGRVFSPDQLGLWAGRLCEAEPGLTRLSFEGRIGAADGWITHSSGDVCDDRALVAGGAP